MSNALPSWQYKNPMEVLERKQEHELRKTCAGCAHGFQIMFETGLAMGCNKHKLYGRRCNLFQEIK